MSDKKKRRKHIAEAITGESQQSNYSQNGKFKKSFSDSELNADNPDEPLPDEPDTNDDNNEENAESSNDKRIEDLGSIQMSKGRHKMQCLTIIGQIEGHFLASPQTKTTKYEHVIPQLVAIEDDPDIEGLLIILNTVGGDVEAGLALAELVAGMKKPTVSLVLGGGHSIGVPLAVSAKQSFIAETATMTIHPVRMNGVILGVPQTLGYFYRMQDRITQFVCQNSKISPDRFKELMMNTSELVMDVGSVLDGKKAVEEGLIDNLGGLSDAIEALSKMIDDKNNSEDKDGNAQMKNSENKNSKGAHEKSQTAKKTAKSGSSSNKKNKGGERR